ncbi:MAG TPA: hypothetical protein DCP63_02220 [Bacteroidetes bacterium]|nr:hypothetical protein [Bacteroidota bacterium]
MIGRLVRFLFYIVVFYFIYKFAKGLLKAFTRPSEREQPQPPPQPNAQASQPPIYLHDVKDASFKDLPEEKSKE